MREGIRNYVSLCPFLDDIVANRTRRTDRFFCIARFNTTLLLREIRPDTGVTIGLQFERDRQAIILTTALYAVHDACQILNVVAKLVRDNVRLRKIARSLKFPL